MARGGMATSTKESKKKGATAAAALESIGSPSPQPSRTRSPGQRKQQLELLDPSAYPTESMLDKVAATRQGTKYVRDCLAVTDRALQQQLAPEMPLQKLRDIGGGGTAPGWRFLFQRGRHFRGESKGQGKWGSRINAAEEARVEAAKPNATAAAKAAAREPEFDQVEVELLRAVMRSLQWKNAAIHPQLQLENAEYKGKIAELEENEVALNSEIDRLRTELARVKKKQRQEKTQTAVPRSRAPPSGPPAPMYTARGYSPYAASDREELAKRKRTVSMPEYGEVGGYGGWREGNAAYNDAGNNDDESEVENAAHALAMAAVKASPTPLPSLREHWAPFHVGDKVEAEFDREGWSSGVVSRVFLPSGDVEVTFDQDSYIERYSPAEQQSELRKHVFHQKRNRQMAPASTSSQYGTGGVRGGSARATPSPQTSTTTTHRGGAVTATLEAAGHDSKRRLVHIDMTASNAAVLSAASASRSGLEHAQYRQAPQQPHPQPRGTINHAQLIGDRQRMISREPLLTALDVPAVTTPASLPGADAHGQWQQSSAAMGPVFTSPLQQHGHAAEGVELTEALPQPGSILTL
eukprot:m.224194 g.224194  ORF g.224194 m.224194 type:complete len:580 (+) comp25873_c0_seq1:339-2078(+)